MSSSTVNGGNSSRPSAQIPDRYEPIAPSPSSKQKLPYRSASESSRTRYGSSTVPEMTQIQPQPTHSTSGSVIGSNGPVRMTQSPGPMMTTAIPGAATAAAAAAAATAVTTSNLTSGLHASRSRAQASVEHMAALQRQYWQHLQYGPGAANVPNTTAAAVQAELRAQTGIALAQVRDVRLSLLAISKAAENHRFRRWLVGGLLASFVPLVRRLWRRDYRRDYRVTSSSKTSSYQLSRVSATEYAFQRSRAVVDRMLHMLKGGAGRLASVAFFVFAVLYVFTNEVTLRVARTVARRLKRLSVKLERGAEPLDEDDLKLLKGWRWRVLLWGSK